MERYRKYPKLNPQDTSSDADYSDFPPSRTKGTPPAPAVADRSHPIYVSSEEEPISLKQRSTNAGLGTTNLANMKGAVASKKQTKVMFMLSCSSCNTLIS